jgi:general stress protein 26
MSDGSPTKQEKLDKLDSLVRDIGVAMFTTTDTNSQRLYSRPMALCGGYDNGAFYFFTYSDSNKVDEFKEDRQVNLAFGCPKDSKFVSVAGIAKTETDRSVMEAKWDESLKAWFADGLDTPGIMLIKVSGTEAQYWDSRNQTMLHAYGVLKATLTGEPVQDAGDNETVTLP